MKKRKDIALRMGSMQNLYHFVLVIIWKLESVQTKLHMTNSFLHIKKNNSCLALLALRPFARFMARRGRSTLNTLRIFTTEIALDL